MGEKAHTYEIGGKVLVQGFPVLGQLQLIGGLLKGLADVDTSDPDLVLAALDSRQYEFMAIVLAFEGEAVSDKDVAGMAAWLRENVRATTARQVVLDFFAWEGLAEEIAAVPNVSLLLTSLLPRRGPGATSGSGSGERSPSSPEGTLSGGKRSSGAARSKRSGRTSK